MRETEILVIGGGPAGIAAATAAARSDRAVMLLDDQPQTGGQIWRKGALAGERRDKAHDAALAQIFQSKAELMLGRRVFDAPAEKTLSTLRGSEVEHIRYDKLILATGARERFLPFPGWTLPGVFGAGGLQALAKGGFAVAGKRVVIAGSGPLLLAVAAHLAEAGATIVGVAEQASMRQMIGFAPEIAASPARLWQAIRFRVRLGLTPYRTGCWPVAALGEGRVSGVRLTDGARVWEERCDLLACGFHLVPNTELASLLGCALHDDFVRVDAMQKTSLGHVYCAGELVAIGGVDAALLQGEIAGLACSGRVREAEHLRNRHGAAMGRFAKRLERAFALRDELRVLARAEDIVCRCEDVRFEQLVPYRSWTEAKLQTRCGMGPCQGRVCGPATQTLFDWKMTSVRAPLSPVPVAALCNNSLELITEDEEMQ